MRVFIVSYFVDPGHYNSSAQNTRFLIQGLLEAGHEVRVISVGEKEETLNEEGYLWNKVPKFALQRKRKWLGHWRPNRQMHRRALEYFDAWVPDVIYMGAWGGLAEFAFVAAERKIPIVQMVHDYSILCIRSWLVDSWGRLCDGPKSLEKCTTCVRHGLGWKAKIKDRVLSFPLFGEVIEDKLSNSPRWDVHVETAVVEALAYMQSYRDLITTYIAQSPSVIDVLRVGGINPDQCRFLPQYIGETKLRRYPRAAGKPGLDRPLRLIYVGRWSTEKGADLLLEAFLASETDTEIELHIVSRSADPEGILNRASDRLDSKYAIYVYTNLGGADVAQKLAQSDVAIVPSTCMELASRVVLEANAQGVPVIVSSSVGNRYVVEDGVNGLIFPTGEVDSLRRCIERLAEAPDVIDKWSTHVKEPIQQRGWLLEFEDIFVKAVES